MMETLKNKIINKCKKYLPQIAVGMMMLIAILLSIGLLVKVGELNKEIAKLQTQINKVQKSALKKQIKELKAENNRISKVVDELAIGFSNILNRVDNLTKEAETKSEIIFSFSKQIKEIQNKELKLKVEIKALKVLLTNTGIAVARNKQERIKNDNNIYKLQNSLKGLKDRLNSKIDWYENKIKKDAIAFDLIKKSQLPESETH